MKNGIAEKKISRRELPALLITALLGGGAAFIAIYFGIAGSWLLSLLLLSFACAVVAVLGQKLPVLATLVPVCGAVALAVGSATRISVLLLAGLVLCGGLLWIGNHYKLDRMKLLLLCSGGVAVALCVGFLLLLADYGGISTGSVDRLFTELEAAFITLMQEQADAVRAAYSAAGVEVPAIFGEATIRESVGLYVSLLRTLLPAEIILIGNLFGYVETRLYFYLARMNGCLADSFGTPQGRQIEISLPGALIYTGSLLLLPILSLFGGDGVFYTVLLNLLLIWLPGLCAVGLRDTMHPLQSEPASGRMPPRPNRVLRFLFLGIVLLFFPIGVPVLLSVYGVLRVVTEAALKRMGPRNGDSEKNDSPEDR